MPKLLTLWCVQSESRTGFNPDDVTLWTSFKAARAYALETNPGLRSATRYAREDGSIEWTLDCDPDLGLDSSTVRIYRIRVNPPR